MSSSLHFSIPAPQTRKKGWGEEGGFNKTTTTTKAFSSEVYSFCSRRQRGQERKKHGALKTWQCWQSRINSDCVSVHQLDVLKWKVCYRSVCISAVLKHKQWVAEQKRPCASRSALCSLVAISTFIIPALSVYFFSPPPTSFSLTSSRTSGTNLGCFKNMMA